jgi:Bacteriocin-protection, YdeI or OmpD-Associated
MTAGDWLTFDAPLEPMPWGRNVYTVVKMPEALARAAAALKTRRVEGMMNGEPVNLGLNRADITPQAFVYAGKSLQRRLGIRAGEVVQCRLRPADPDEVPVPDDVVSALADAGLTDAFEHLRPAKRRQLLATIEFAASDATRSTRISDLVRGLSPE